MAIRSDKARNLKALKNELLKDPLQTEEELGRKIGIARGSVNRLKDEMSEIVTNAKNADIIAITDEDKEIIQLSQFLSKSKLRDLKKQYEEGEKLEMRDVKIGSEIAKESTARYSLFRGNATDKDGGLNLPIPIIPLDIINGGEDRVSSVDKVG